MPRIARKKSNTDVYHVMMRGINKQSIFEDEEDHLRFIEILRLVKKKSDFKIYAWCIMGTHVHLLMQFGEESPEKVMKKIDVTYAVYYNKKNGRLGPVFADRFRSEPVEDDAYLMGAARYIHRNPVKAGMCERPQEYDWSSYSEYLRAGKKRTVSHLKVGITDTELVMGMHGIDELIKYTNTPNEDELIELSDKKVVTDEKTGYIMKKVTGCSNVSEFAKLSGEKKTHTVKKLLNDGVYIADTEDYGS